MSSIKSKHIKVKFLIVKERGHSGVDYVTHMYILYDCGFIYDGTTT